MMFESITNNYSMAKKIMGETLIRLISGYNPSYIERNIRIPEFKRELKKRLEDNIEELREDKLLKRDYSVSEEGIKLASIVTFAQELDNIVPKGIFGEKDHKKISHYGNRGEVRNYKKGDRYKDIHIRESIKLAIRRGHPTVSKEDLKTSDRESRGKVHVIYAIDASGSMKGKKLEMSKKAGIALAYKAINSKDKVGLIAFGSEVKEEIEPTDDFMLLLTKITMLTASRQTDFKGMLHRAVELFSPGNYTKHLMILSDAMPTVGEEPEKETLREISAIKNAGVTVSLIGINLDDKSKLFAEKIVQIGEGKIYLVRETDEIDRIVLEDYYSVV